MNLPDIPTRQDFEIHMAILLAGRIAGELLTGMPSTVAGGSLGSDLARVGIIAATLETSCCLGTSLLLAKDPAFFFVFVFVDLATGEAFLNDIKRCLRGLCRMMAYVMGRIKAKPTDEHNGGQDQQAEKYDHKNRSEKHACPTASPCHVWPPSISLRIA